MRIVCLAGGVGGARFLRGLVDHLDQTSPTAPAERPQVTIIGNTGDDITLAGLRVCPDLDTLVYTIGGGVDEGQGWGRADDTRAAAEELSRLGALPTWFGLGDRDLATHIARSQWLGQGLTLTEVTSRLAQRWGLDARGVRLLPATDVPIETHVVVSGADPDVPEQAMHFQEWWIKHQAALPARRFTVAGLDRAVPAPGVLDALRTADVILLPPSNPVVSLGIIMMIPGIRDALSGARAPVVGVSPIIGGAPVRGHADACLAPLGVEVSPSGVAGLFADLLSGWLVDSADEPGPDQTAAGADYPPGLAVRYRNIWMRDREQAADLAGATLTLATEIAAERVA